MTFPMEFLLKYYLSKLFHTPNLNKIAILQSMDTQDIGLRLGELDARCSPRNSRSLVETRLRGMDFLIDVKS